MNTRTLLAIPYGITRGPLSVITKITQRLPRDSYPRLAYDRALGSYDRFAGRLLADDAIVQRGTRRLTRSSELAEAVDLEREAAARREQAQQVAGAGHDAAQEKRRAAQERATESLDTAVTIEQRGKRAAASAARKQAAQEKRAAQAGAERRSGAIRQRAARSEKAADARQSAARRGANSKLTEVNRTKAAAQEARADADKLAELAQAKKAERKA